MRGLRGVNSTGSSLVDQLDPFQATQYANLRLYHFRDPSLFENVPV